MCFFLKSLLLSRFSNNLGDKFSSSYCKNDMFVTCTSGFLAELFRLVWTFWLAFGWPNQCKSIIYLFSALISSLKSFNMSWYLTWINNNVPLSLKHSPSSEPTNPKFVDSDSIVLEPSTKDSNLFSLSPFPWTNELQLFCTLDAINPLIPASFCVWTVTSDDSSLIQKN